MRELIDAIAGEYARYKALGEGALRQVEDTQLSMPGPESGNSLAVIVWHLAGNFSSRFTDFLTSDGEKPWRRREEEFATRVVSRTELMDRWNGGWAVLMATLASLRDQDLSRTVFIRQKPLSVREALLRSVTHASYHVGQMVYLAKMHRSTAWQYLSIPPGGSAAYNSNPTNEHSRGHASNLDDATEGRT